jgi:peptidoglycan hydrolase CwlO-like protein
MKKFFFSCVCILAVFSSPAQQIVVKENLEKVGGGINNALVVNIPEADKDNVSKAWRKLMNGSGAKVSGRTEIDAENVKIPLITTDTLFIFTVLDQKDGYVHQASAFRIKGEYLSSVNNPSAYREAERLVYNFAFDQARNAVQEKVDKEKRKLARLEKEFTDLDTENKDLAKDIETYTNRIQKAQATIKDNEKKKETTSRDIEQQRKVVDLVIKKLSEIK